MVHNYIAPPDISNSSSLSAFKHSLIMHMCMYASSINPISIMAVYLHYFCASNAMHK